MPSSVKVGVRPSSLPSRAYSSAFSPWAMASFSSTLGSASLNARALSVWRFAGRRGDSLARRRPQAVAPDEATSPKSIDPGRTLMTETALSDLYRAYIGCLNRQDWETLHKFVHRDARHNGRPFGLVGYRAMLERDFEEIPDLQFNIELLVCEPPFVASRLRFDCRPKGLFLGLAVNGRRVVFAENVFYRFRSGKIDEVWSPIDK